MKARRQAAASADRVRLGVGDKGEPLGGASEIRLCHRANRQQDGRRQTATLLAPCPSRGWQRRRAAWRVLSAPGSQRRPAAWSTPETPACGGARASAAVRTRPVWNGNTSDHSSQLTTPSSSLAQPLHSSLWRQGQCGVDDFLLATCQAHPRHTCRPDDVGTLTG